MPGLAEKLLLCLDWEGGGRERELVQFKSNNASCGAVELGGEKGN